MLIPRQLVHVINLQRMGFLSAYSVQSRYARFHLDEMSNIPGSHGFNVILLAEHNPVYTVGIRDKGYSELEEQKLKDTGAEFHRTNRGGLITFHGPGQLVAYPIINLKKFRMGMRDYVCQLEKTMIKTCAGFGLAAKTSEHTGVWIGDKKIGAIGIHGSRFITTHGISLNCNTDLSWYKHIVPCGLEGKEVTSISQELGKDVSINDTIPIFLEAFKDRFNCDIDTTFLLQEDHEILPTEENLKRVESLKAAG